MKILNRFTIKNLKLNKKRTIVTIIGIMLSTALICGVTGLVYSFQNTLIEIAKNENGNLHTTFYDVPKDKFKYITANEQVKDYFITEEVGWANLEGSKNESKPYMQISAYDEKALENYGIKLIEGRLPENSKEIVIPESIRTNARVDLKIGDTIKIDVGERRLETGEILGEDNPYNVAGIVDGEILQVEEKLINTKQKTYTIVGIMEPLDYTKYHSPGYKVITYLEDAGETADISVLYKKAKEYETLNNEICKNTGVEVTFVNIDLLRYQGVLNDGALNAVYTIGAVVIAIIIVSSVFVIRNSFSISVSERNRQYGMLASIGATSKQIKKNVVFEGFVIGLIAIPLGILLGIVAIMILLEVVNLILGDLLLGERFVYRIEIFGIIFSIILGFITIYLSCLIPAKRAAKISPIESIRGNNDIKMKSKKVKTAKVTKRIFGIGGVIARKNLKRSKKKYRTTVISIVISIFIFISLSTFITYGMETATFYYTDFPYNVQVRGESEEVYKEIAKLENVDKYAYAYETSVVIDVNKYAKDLNRVEDFETTGPNLVVYNNEYFREYIKELGLKEADYKTATILIDDYILYDEDGSKTNEKIYNIKKGDTIEIQKDDIKKNVKISSNPDKRPMGIEKTYTPGGYLIVSQDFVKEVLGDSLENNYRLDDLRIDSSNPDELENTLNDLQRENDEYIDIKVENLNTYVSSQKKVVLVAAIFLYGFITVISLIGVTNIFNTITTNMILRSKEFATLKSIGMTKKEFNRMIRLESIMYGLKSLIIGIPLGLAGSYAMYKAFSQDLDVGYIWPVKSIIIAVVFVFIIIGITMKYSLNKINKQNIIETIRKDNI